MTASEMFIDGQFRTVSSVEPVTDAVTEQVLGEGPDAGLGDIDEAVGASRGALPDWSATPEAERAHFLERFADALAARVEDISQLRSRETGAPMSFLRILSGLRT
jgi:aldehyde dehydrogenase (NAD+)